MSNSDLDKIIEAAHGYHQRNGYDLDEVDMQRAMEATWRKNWHECLALAIDDLDFPPIKKLQLFSECLHHRLEATKNDKCPF